MRGRLSREREGGGGGEEEWGGGGGGGESTREVVAVCRLLNVPANMLVYLRDGSAQTIARAATLR